MGRAAPCRLIAAGGAPGGTRRRAFRPDPGRAVDRGRGVALQAVLLLRRTEPGPPRVPEAGAGRPRGRVGRTRGLRRQAPMRKGPPPAPVEDAGVPGTLPEVQVGGPRGGP